MTIYRTHRRLIGEHVAYHLMAELGKLVSFAQAMHSNCKDDQMKHTFCKQGNSYVHDASAHKHTHTNLKNRSLR